MIMDNFHSCGNERRSISERKRTESGNDSEGIVWWKKIGGRLSGPAAELILIPLKNFSDNLWRDFIYQKYLHNHYLDDLGS